MKSCPAVRVAAVSPASPKETKAYVLSGIADYVPFVQDTDVESRTILEGKLEDKGVEAIRKCELISSTVAFQFSNLLSRLRKGI